MNRLFQFSVRRVRRSTSRHTSKSLGFTAETQIRYTPT